MINKSLLRTFQPCNSLGDWALDEVMGIIKVARAPKGSIIFKRGRPLDAYYFLLSGKINLIDNQFNASTLSAGDERAVLPINADPGFRISAIAASPVTYITVDLERFNEILAQQHQVEVAATVDPFAGDATMEVAEIDAGSDWAASLLTSPLFRNMGNAQLHHLFSCFETCRVVAGERILREGAPAEYFYVLTEGRARVFDRSGDVAVELLPGQAFGDEALVSGAPRNATVEMLENGAVKRLAAADFEQLVAEPALGAAMVRNIEDVKTPARIIDVRLPLEYRSGHLPGSVNLPLTRLRRDLPSLSGDVVYLVPDSAGCRARTAVYLLRKAGLAARLLSTADIAGQVPALQTA